MLLTVAGAPMESTTRWTTGRTCCGLAATAPFGGDGAGGASEIEEVGALCVVEPQRVRERGEDAVGGAGGVAALQALVVLDAHPGQRRHLLTAQARHLTPAVVRAAQPAPA